MVVRWRARLQSKDGAQHTLFRLGERALGSSGSLKRPAIGAFGFFSQKRAMKERQDDNPKSPDEVQDRIWELAEKIDICMLTSWDGEQQRSRPGFGAWSTPSTSWWT